MDQRGRSMQGKPNLPLMFMDWLNRPQDFNPAEVGVPKGTLVDMVRSMPALNQAALATSPIPVVGDLMGLAADARMYASEPESRTAGNFGLSALGMLPFVPALATMRGFHATDNVFDAFDPSKRRTAKHIYFAVNPDDAKPYGRHMVEADITGEIGDFTNLGVNEYRVMQRAYEDHGLADHFESFDDFLEAFESGDMYQRFANSYAQDDVIDALLEVGGFDALVIPDAGFGGAMSSSIVAKDPAVAKIIGRK